VEPLAAGCLLVPTGIRSLLQEKKGLLVALFAVLLIPQIHFLVQSIQNPRFRNEAQIQNVVEKAEGFVLTDNPRLAVLSDRPFFVDPLVLTTLEMAGKWDSGGIRDLLLRCEIPLVILSLPVDQSLSWQGTKRLPQKVIGAIRQNYRLCSRIDGYYIYEPNSQTCRTASQ